MNKSILVVVLIVPLVIGGMFFINRNSKKMSNQNNSFLVDSPVGTMSEPEEKQSFSGEKGSEVKLENNQVIISVTNFETNKIRFFNTTLADGKTIYYIILKDKDGNFRAAANANQQCASFGKGYRQVGDEIECLTCNKKYPLTDFAIEQPDCNPKPISSNLTLKDNQITITLSDLEKVSYLF